MGNSCIGILCGREHSGKRGRLQSQLSPGRWGLGDLRKSRGTSEHESSLCVGKAASCKGWRLASKRDLNPVREVIKQEMEVEKERDP